MRKAARERGNRRAQQLEQADQDGHRVAAGLPQVPAGIGSQKTSTMKVLLKYPIDPGTNKHQTSHTELDLFDGEWAEDGQTLVIDCHRVGMLGHRPRNSKPVTRVTIPFGNIRAFVEKLEPPK